MKMRFLTGSSSSTLLAKDTSNNSYLIPIEPGAVYFTTDLKIFFDTLDGERQCMCENVSSLDIDAGSATRPVYFYGGIPVLCNNTLDVNITGSANNIKNSQITAAELNCLLGITGNIEDRLKAIEEKLGES